MTSLAEIQADVPHAIQLALAPIFLLTGIAGMLNVMAARLARIVDRDRQLMELASKTDTYRESHARELRCLERRRGFADAAITACTTSALLVCVVIAALFFEALLGLPLKWFEGILFAAATVALVIGLALFLREVHLATRSVHIEMQRPEVNSIPDNQ